MYCFEHQGWAEQRKVHFPIPGGARGRTEPTPPAEASAVLQGLGESGRGGRKPTYTMKNAWLNPG